MNTNINIVRPWQFDRTVYFWHPPKTAGGSIWFNLQSASKEHGRPYWYRVPDLRKMDPVDPGFYKLLEEETTWQKHLPVQKTTISNTAPAILSVRDPYSRCAAMHAYYIKHCNKAIEAGTWPEKASIKNMTDWLSSHCFHPPIWTPWKHCAYWRHHLKGPVAIIRYENLKEDFKEVTGHPWIDVQYNRTSEWTRERALEVLSRRDIENINYYFAEDFEMFGYEKV